MTSRFLPYFFLTKAFSLKFDYDYSSFVIAFAEERLSIKMYVYIYRVFCNTYAAHTYMYTLTVCIVSFSFF